MSHDVVTAKDAAAPAAISRSPDPERICALLDTALSTEGFEPATYSAPVISVFQQAWAVAAHKQSTNVTIFHLAYALIFDNPQIGAEVAEHLGTDVDTLAVGCILQILPLGVSTGDASIVPAAVGTVRWLGAAAARAKTAGRQREVWPEDLIAAVLSYALPTFEQAGLRKAARIGNARRETVLGTRPVQPIADPSRDQRDIIEHLQEVERGGGTVPDANTNGDELLALIEEIQLRQSTEFVEQKATLARIEATSEKRHALVEQRLLPVMAIPERLGAIDQCVAAIQGSLPRPPSTARLTATIVAVLLLGVASGLALTALMPASRLAQSVLAIMR